MDALHQPTSSTDDDDGKKLRRREQNRLSAQRSYHKKQERISTLRAQVSQLESTYERHVNSLPREPVVDASLSCPPTASSPACVSGTVDAKSHAVSPSSPPQKSSHMQQLLANRSELQHENDALRRRIEDHTKFQFRMQSLAVDDESSMDPTAGDTRSRTGEPRFQPRIQMKRPLSVDECYAIGSSSYQYIRNHRFPDKYMTSGSSLCGWRDRRVLENGLLKVELRKTFQGHDIDLVTRTSWAAVQDPHKMSALYSLNMNMQSEIVQRIDDNNTVMYQSYETPERDAAGNETGAFVVMHHVMLLTMFATDRGYVMIFCSLDPDRLDDSDHIVDLAEEEEAAARGVTKRRRKQWFKKFSWLTFQRNGRQTRDDAFELSYLFTVPPQHGAKHYWPLEIILLMMRFEMAAVGPVVLLPPSTSTNNLKDEDEADGMKQHATDKEENDDDDEDSGVVIIENTPIKIEPLAHSGTEDVSIADDDMSELFTELFP